MKHNTQRGARSLLNRSDRPASSDLQVSRDNVTLRSLVEDKLRKAIIYGRFKVGQRLVERELCELFGVGRTSIRESLRQLEAEGLVYTVPHKGPTVCSFSYEDARQLYALREVLEGFAGEQFALKSRPEDIEKVSGCFDRLVVASDPFDADAWLDGINMFYGVLIEGCGNIFVVQILRTLYNRINILRAHSIPKPERVERSIIEMREIVDAVRLRDGPRAASACRYHVQMAEEAALAQLRANLSS